MFRTILFFWARGILLIQNKLFSIGVRSSLIQNGQNPYGMTGLEPIFHTFLVVVSFSL
jgi:hypothetical protein